MCMLINIDRQGLGEDVIIDKTKRIPWNGLLLCFEHLVLHAPQAKPSFHASNVCTHFLTQTKCWYIVARLRSRKSSITILQARENQHRVPS